jgi:hypothetical protein
MSVSLCVVFKLTSLSRMQVALLSSYLRSYLANPAALRTTTRRQLSDILLISYVHQVLVHRSPRDGGAAPATDDAAPDEASAKVLDHFLKTNSDYSTKLATRLLLDASAIDLLLEMAKVRGDVHEVLTLAVSERALKFPPTAIDKVLARGLGDEICSFEGGLLLQYLPSIDVIKLLLGAEEPDLFRCYRHAGGRLGGLDEMSLRALADAFQPGAPGTTEILQEQTVLRTGGEWTTSAYVEFYLQLLLELRKRDCADEAKQGTVWRVNGADMMLVSSDNVGASASVKSAMSTAQQQGSPTGHVLQSGRRSVSPQKAGPDQPISSPTYMSASGRVRTISECSSDSVGSLTTLVPNSRSGNQSEGVEADGSGSDAGAGARPGMVEPKAWPAPRRHVRFEPNSIMIQRFSAVLPSAFTELYGMYNIASMIQHCLTIGDCDSAAHLYV